MSTKKESTTTNQYDPQSLNQFHGWTGSLYSPLQQLFNNPTGSPFFNFNLQQNQKAASGLAGRGMSNALLNFGRSGFGTLGGGMRQSLLAGLNRVGSGLQYQGWANTMGQAQSDRWNAAGLGSSLFQPLQTGQQNVQKTSGLGTWLPQVLGAGASIAGAFFGAPGIGAAFGGSGGGAPNAGGLGGMSGLSGIGSQLPFGGPMIPGTMPTSFAGVPNGGSSFTPSGFNPFLPGGGV